MEMPGRDLEPDPAGEDDERHDARLQQRDVIADRGRRMNGGGESAAKACIAAPAQWPGSAAMTGSSS